MTLQTIELGFAERYIVHIILANLKLTDIATARTVRDVRKRLELKKVLKEVNMLIDVAKASGKGVDWDDILDYGKETEGKNKETLSAEKKFIPRTFTVDGSYIKFIQEKLDAHEWNTFTDRQGQKHTEIAIPLGQLEAIANLADALLDAKPTKESHKESK